MAHSILLSGDRDARAAGFTQIYSGWQYEELSNAALLRVADDQREAILPKLQLDLEAMDYQIYTTIQEAGA